MKQTDSYIRSFFKKFLNFFSNERNSRRMLIKLCISSQNIRYCCTQELVERKIPRCYSKYYPQRITAFFDLKSFGFVVLGSKNFFKMLRKPANQIGSFCKSCF